MGRGWARKRTLAAVALAAIAHLAALVGLGWRVPAFKAPLPTGDSQAVELTLIRPPPAIAQGQPKGSAKSRPVPPASAQRERPTALPSQTAVALPPAPPVSDQQANAIDPTGEQLRGALRGLLGCSDPAAYRLDPQQKAACDHRVAAPANVQAQIDPEAQAAFDAGNQKDSILVRKPNNGCLPRLADQPGGSTQTRGRSGATTKFGLGCSWSFW